MAERGKIVDSEDELDISSIVGVSSIKSTHRDDAKINQDLRVGRLEKQGVEVDVLLMSSKRHSKFDEA